jgi:hypothetical protein
MTNNACPPRLTAAAGTSISRDSTSLSNVILILNERTLQLNKAVIIQIVLLDQTFVHCPIFLTAGRKFSLDLIPVPVWLIILSDQLKIKGLVSFYIYQLPNLAQTHLLTEIKFYYIIKILKLLLVLFRI